MVKLSPEPGFVNRINGGHLETSGDSTPPHGPYNPYLAQWTAAWFKIHLERTPMDQGIDFEDMLVGTGPGSLCHAAHGDVQTCDIRIKARRRGGEEL
jgi:hypothetical protein